MLAISDAWAWFFMVAATCVSGLIFWWSVGLVRATGTATAGAVPAHAAGGGRDESPPAPFHLRLASAAAAARATAAVAAGMTLAELCAQFPLRGQAPFTVALEQPQGRPWPARWWPWPSPLRRRPAHPHQPCPAATTSITAAATAAAAACLLRDEGTPKHALTYATLDALVGCGVAGAVGLLTAPMPDDAWRAARRAAAPALGPAGVSARWASITAAASRAVGLVVPCVPLNLDDLGTRAALDGAAALVFGVAAGGTDPPGSARRAGPTGADALLASLAAGLVEVDARWAAVAASAAAGKADGEGRPAPPAVSWWGVCGWQGLPPPPPPLPPPRPPTGAAALATFHACVRRLVGESLESCAAGDPTRPAPVVLELAARGGPRGAPLPRPALDAHAAALTLAGADAVGHAAAWGVALLAAHPAAAARAEAELEAGGWLVRGGRPASALAPLPADAVAPSATGGGSGGRLPFLRACLLEAMRLFPPAPAAVREGCAGAVLISPHAWHRCPAHFGAPGTFLPERWLVVGAEWMGSSVGAPPARRWRRFAPFGEGARACPGAALANSLGVALLAALVGRFRWRLVGDGGGAPLPSSSSPSALVAHLHTRVAATAVTLAPAGGLWAVAEAR